MIFKMVVLPACFSNSVTSLEGMHVVISAIVILSCLQSNLLDFQYGEIAVTYSVKLLSRMA